MDPYKRKLISWAGADIREKYVTKGHGSKKERKRREKDARQHKKAVRRELQAELEELVNEEDLPVCGPCCPSCNGHSIDVNGESWWEEHLETLEKDNGERIRPGTFSPILQKKSGEETGIQQG